MLSWKNIIIYPCYIGCHLNQPKMKFNCVALLCCLLFTSSSCSPVEVSEFSSFCDSYFFLLGIVYFKDVFGLHYCCLFCVMCIVVCIFRPVMLPLYLLRAYFVRMPYGLPIRMIFFKLVFSFIEILIRIVNPYGFFLNVFLLLK